MKLFRSKSKSEPMTLLIKSYPLMHIALSSNRALRWEMYSLGQEPKIQINARHTEMTQLKYKPRNLVT